MPAPHHSSLLNSQMRQLADNIHGADDVRNMLFEINGVEGALHQLCKMIFDGDVMTSRKAAWVMTHATVDELTSLKPRIADLVPIAATTNDSTHKNTP